jgi:hypothetical protein
MKITKLKALREKWSADPDARGFREELEELLSEIEAEVDELRSAILFLGGIHETENGEAAQPAKVRPDRDDQQRDPNRFMA